jgi:hypothetical protein
MLKKNDKVKVYVISFKNIRELPKVSGTSSMRPQQHNKV